MCERLNMVKGQSVSADVTNIERERKIFTPGKLSGVSIYKCYYFDITYVLFISKKQ
ncbi:hypothetical protein [Lysinibacillus xylanilyticus]|uniref:hypothetical protein n=1 Tax=Lysinibacillus xylanilyticus TaxID=582475 RepID=UPI00380F9875